MKHNFDLQAHQGKLLIAGLLVSLLLTIGCSKENSKPSSSAVLTPPVSTSANQNMAPVVVPSTTQPVAQKPAAKKAVKKHASMVTYKDDSYGLSFGYPRKYTLKTGEDLKSDSTLAAMNFVQEGGVTAVSVGLPENAYPNTDLTSAFFQVNVLKGVGESECGQFATPAAKPGDKNGILPQQVQLGDMNLQEVENITGESAKQLDTKYYHLFDNGSCYEFALGLTTAWDGNEDGVNMVDREDVFRRLEKILAGVKIAQEVAPVVASSGDSAPTSPVAAVSSGTPAAGAPEGKTSGSAGADPNDTNAQPVSSGNPAAQPAAPQPETIK